jgi:hypothetical protein
VFNQSKYHNRKTEVDGIVFDSQKEALYYQELKLLQRAGEVVNIELQPKFELIPPYVNDAGNKIRATYYRADFKVEYKDGHIEIIDIKPSASFKTKEYRLKKKMFEYKYSMVIKEVY